METDILQFLKPLFREFRFIIDASLRQKYRKRGEDMVRKLVLRSGLDIVQPSLHAAGAGRKPLRQHLQDDEKEPPTQKKLRLSLLRHVDSHKDRRDVFSTDEIKNYLNMKVGNIIPDGECFVADNFATVKFWYSRKENSLHSSL